MVTGWFFLTGLWLCPQLGEKDKRCFAVFLNGGRCPPNPLRLKFKVGFCYLRDCQVHTVNCVSLYLSLVYLYQYVIVLFYELSYN